MIDLSYWAVKKAQNLKNTTTKPLNQNKMNKETIAEAAENYSNKTEEYVGSIISISTVLSMIGSLLLPFT